MHHNTVIMAENDAGCHFVGPGCFVRTYHQVETLLWAYSAEVLHILVERLLTIHHEPAANNRTSGRWSVNISSASPSPYYEDTPVTIKQWAALATTTFLCIAMIASPNLVYLRTGTA